jgi:hypothetical protein
MLLVRRMLARCHVEIPPCHHGGPLWRKMPGRQNLAARAAVATMLDLRERSPMTCLQCSALTLISIKPQHILEAGDSAIVRNPETLTV